MEKDRFIDIGTLTLDEIKSGVGGFSTDANVIEDNDLRQYMTEVSEYFDDNPQDVYAIFGVVKDLEPIIGGNTNTKATKNKMVNNMFTHFYRHKGLIMGERIEIEAVLAVIFVQKRFHLKAPFQDVVDETIEKLGKHYSSVPLRAGGPNRHSVSYLSEETLLQYSAYNSEDIVFERKKKDVYFPDYVIEEAKEINLESVEEVSEAVNKEIKKHQGIDKLSLDAISWPRIGISPGIGEMLTFIYMADKNEIDKYNNDGLINYSLLGAALAKCRDYIVEYGERIPNLATLYMAIKRSVESKS